MSTKLDHLKKQNWDNSLLAVSGGVDSIVLLNILASSKAKFEVAYIDHSQRADTHLDIRAIQALTDKYNIRLHTSKLYLPADCSEQQARTERYKALDEIKKTSNLEYLITAHHADDALETAIINLVRGTGPRGLSSLRHQGGGIWRPFLFDFQNQTYITKQDILDYAKDHQLVWHEDSTNQSPDYLRNRIRKQLENSKPEDKIKFLDIISKNIGLTDQIDQGIYQLDIDLKEQQDKSKYSIKRFKELPEELKDQLLHRKISQYGYDVNKDSISRAKAFIQTKTTGKVLQLKGCHIMIFKGGLFQIETTKK